jgi:hypothetical protein
MLASLYTDADADGAKENNEVVAQVDVRGQDRLFASLQRKLSHLSSDNLRLRCLSLAVDAEIESCSLLVEGTGQADGEYHLLKHEKGETEFLEFVRRDELLRVYSLTSNGKAWLLSVADGTGLTVLQMCAATQTWPPAVSDNGFCIRPIRKSACPDSLAWARSACDASNPDSNDGKDPMADVPEWFEVHDPIDGGQISYLNLDTGESQWEKPEGYSSETQVAFEQIQEAKASAAGAVATDIFGPSPFDSEGNRIPVETKELTRCTVEVTPTEALSPEGLTALYESFAALGLEGVEQVGCTQSVSCVTRVDVPLVSPESTCLCSTYGTHS